MLGRRPTSRCPRQQQRGAFAMAAMVAMMGLLAMLGLAIDGGRLMSSKAKLQSAADACALAAAAELANCSDRTACLSDAVNQGTAAANANKTELEATPTALGVQSVTFSPDGTAGSYTTAATYPLTNTNPRYVACTTRQASVSQVFAGVFSFFNNNTPVPWGASAEARATLASGSQMCMNVPMGACANYTDLAKVATNTLITTTFQDNGGNGSTSLGGTGAITLQWLSVASGGGSVPDIQGQVVQAKPNCYPPGTVFTAQGVKQGVKDAYNTRFRLYTSSYTVTSAPPDGSGRVPTSDLSKGAYTSFLPTYLSSLNDFSTSGSGRVYNDPKQGGGGGNKSLYSIGSATPTTQQNHITYGLTQRRLLSVPVFNTSTCTGNMTLQSTVKSICILALSPVTNGASGSIYFEYLGDATQPGNPCYGGPAARGTFSSTGFGSSIPVLVQ